MIGLAETFPGSEMEKARTGRPGGLWNISAGADPEDALEMQLEDDEWTYEQDLDEDGNVEANYIFFGAWVIDILDAGASHEAEMYLVEDPGTPVTISPLSLQNDMEISEEVYNALVGGDDYITITDFDGTARFLSGNSDPDTRNWWSEEADGRLYYQKYEAGGKWYIRFWPDFGGMGGVIYAPVVEVLPGSSEYYDTYIAGMPGLLANHKTWACKADVIEIHDSGQLTPAQMTGRAFTVRENFGLFYDQTVAAYVTTRETAGWTAVDAGDIRVQHGSGIVLLKGAAVEAALAAGDMCVKI